ncbi:Homoserine kinase [Falsiruegeria litorea R37]|uniref:Homoserine kinase n=1 Tax=Falsiruegeria litorea R37 TaxID=1200284 RepID=A0A1Y5TUZ9_9RHOB|nr:homoserine kinase [Falsiruegeria litorea]SLN72556.1 Homoserine kinase [Falsiruegeria litorea R37]
MSGVVDQALELWGLSGSQVTLIATRENHVYRVDREDTSFALRLHRRGLHSNAALQSELAWLSALGGDGIGVPTPLAALDGQNLHTVDGIQVDVLSWLPGRPLGSTSAGIDHSDSPAVFRAIGREMARFHRASDRWTPPAAFSRWSWDRAGLLGDAPLWGRFWENPTLTGDDSELLTRYRRVANTDLAQMEASLDYGLIHADLVRENIMTDGQNVRFIDFDDAGFGFRLFDIATALVKNLNEPDYPLLKDALLDGYRQERDIDTALLDLFLSLRAVTYVGWITLRLSEEGGPARNTRFIETARTVVSEYLNRSAHGEG